MDYITLAQTARIKCRMPGSGPTAVTGQTAEYQRLLLYINEAWLEVQNARTDWRFMRGSATCPTVNAQYAYSPTTDFGLTDFAYWALDYQQNDTFRNYVTASGLSSEIFMETWDYDWWRDAYLYGALRTAYTRPIGVAVAPDNTLVCGPIPASGYTLVGDYYKIPSQMSAATDTPSLPSQFHWVIVYGAMKRYGISESAPEVYDEGEAGWQRMMREVILTQTRRMTLPGALA